LVVQALMMTRDGIFEPDGHHNRLPVHGSLDNPMELENWDPWVRASLLQAEVCEGLSYAAGGSDAFKLRLCEVDLFSLTRPSPQFFAGQLPLVQSWAALREERMAEILTQIDHQVAFIAAITGLKADRHRWTWEWLGAALSLVIAVEVRFKHALACRRPVVYSPQVQPVITTPGHGAYPMGHAAQIHMLAELLKVLLCLKDSPAQAQQLDRLAERVSINRVVAGVHFPIDAHAGRALGRAMARYFLLRCGLGPIDAPSGFGQGLQDEQAASWDVPGEKGTAHAKADWLVPTAGSLLQRLTQLALGELHRSATDSSALDPCGGSSPAGN
jgi:membrane-associated phospholipid phosphatase